MKYHVILTRDIRIPLMKLLKIDMRNHSIIPIIRMTQDTHMLNYSITWLCMLIILQIFIHLILTTQIMIMPCLTMFIKACDMILTMICMEKFISLQLTSKLNSLDTQFNLILFIHLKNISLSSSSLMMGSMMV